MCGRDVRAASKHEGLSRELTNAPTQIKARDNNILRLHSSQLNYVVIPGELTLH
jgi:hypothetical protein